jgi:hypothetical protein
MGAKISVPTAGDAAEDLDAGYRVELLGPHRWRLDRGGREVGIFASASEARAAARRHEIRRRLGRRALAHVSVALLGASVLLAAQPFADVPNPAAVRARSFVDAMDAAYGAIRSGAADPTEFTRAVDGFDGAVVSSDGSAIGGGGPATERIVLVGSFEGDCYVVRWPPAGPVTTGVLEPDLACEPSPALVWQEVFIRSSVATMRDVPIWEGVLPPETTRVRWYLPAVIAAVLFMVDGVIGATVALIRRGRGG